MPWYPLNQIDVKTNGLEEKGLYIKPPYKPIFDTTTLKAEQFQPTDPGCIRIEMTAYPRPEVDWYWQKIKIKRKTDKCESLVTDLGNDRYLCELKVHAFSIYDAGDYRIVATSRIGKSVYTFNIKADPERNKPRILEGPISRYLGDHKYRLEVTAWCPEFERCVWEKWRKNERKGTQKSVLIDLKAKCTNSDEYRIKRGAIERGAEGIYDIFLEISEATINDRGTYRCIIYDKNNMLSCIFSLVLDIGDIIGRPELYSEPRIFQMKTENIIMAFCIRSSDPLKYSWVLPSGETVQQDKLDGRDKMVFTQRKLKPPSGEDHLYEGKLDLDHWYFAQKGHYTCLAENRYGILQIKFELKVTPTMMDNKSRWYEELYG